LEKAGEKVPMVGNDSRKIESIRGSVSKVWKKRAEKFQWFDRLTTGCLGKRAVTKEEFGEK
jgi:hypothetical protein